MYSNNKSFSFVDILIKIVFFVALIFVLVYLFPQISDLNPFYNNIFRENISYMKEAAEGYFNNNLPTELGDTKKLTLKQMIDMNLIIPFVDKENNSCNLYKSYAEIIKIKDGYKLKVNLVCNGEADYIETTLGCNNYCDGVICKNCKCDEEKPAPAPSVPTSNSCTEKRNTVYYQFKKANTTISTSYYCEEGYSLKDKTCYRTVQGNREKAIPQYNPDTTVVVGAIRTPGSVTKEYVDPIVKENVISTPTTTTVELTPVKIYVPGTTSEEAYPCTTYTTENKCTTTYKEESHECDCVSVYKNGRYIETCDVCTETVEVQTCDPVIVPHRDTCYKPVTTSGSYKYTCPAGTDRQTGSDSSLRCYSTRTIYENDVTKSYSCPANVDGSEGSNASLKCYYLKTTPDTYRCENSKARRVNNLCYITQPGGFRGYKCKDSSYKLDGDYCYTEKEEATDALVNTSTSTDWQFEWSTSLTMDGWVRTGLTNTSTTTVVVPCK